MFILLSMEFPSTSESTSQGPLPTSCSVDVRADVCVSYILNSYKSFLSNGGGDISYIMFLLPFQGHPFARTCCISTGISHICTECSSLTAGVGAAAVIFGPVRSGRIATADLHGRSGTAGVGGDRRRKGGNSREDECVELHGVCLLLVLLFNERTGYTEEGMASRSRNGSVLYRKPQWGRDVLDCP